MKKLAILFALLVVLSALSASALAAQDMICVVDTALLLSAEEIAALDEQAQEVSGQYQCGVYIVILDDYTLYSDEYIIDYAAEEIYDQLGAGVGGDRSGIMLLLSMAERDYTLLAFGYGNTAFTDYGKDVLAEAFLDDFRNDNWYSGFSSYIAESGRMLSLARQGQPVDIGGRAAGNTDTIVAVVISLGLGCVVALIVCSIMRGKMKSVSPGSEAMEYLRSGSVNITIRQDRFTHRTSTRVRINNDSGRSGGGRSGGTTVRSSGFSSKSGKF